MRYPTCTLSKLIIAFFYFCHFFILLLPTSIVKKFLLRWNAIEVSKKLSVHLIVFNFYVLLSASDDQLNKKIFLNVLYRGTLFQVSPLHYYDICRICSNTVPSVSSHIHWSYTAIRNCLILFRFLFPVDTEE